MDGEQRKSKSLVVSTLAVLFVTAALFFGGITTANQAYAQIVSEEDAPAGHAFFTTEQILSPLEECFAVIDSLGVTLVGQSAPPEVVEAIEVEAEKIANETQASEEVEIIVQNLTEEVAQNNTAVAEVLPGHVNETAVTTEVAESAVVGELLENKNVTKDIVEVVITGAESTLNNDATPEEAAAEVEANATEVLGEVEITVQDVEQAAEEVMTEDTVAEDITTTAAVAPSKEAAPVAPSKEGDVVTKETPAAVVAEEEEAIPSTPAVDVAVDKVVEEAAPEIAEESGEDLATVKQLLEKALTLLG